MEERNLTTNAVWSTCILCFLFHFTKRLPEYTVSHDAVSDAILVSVQPPIGLLWTHLTKTAAVFMQKVNRSLVVLNVTHATNSLIYSRTLARDR